MRSGVNLMRRLQNTGEAISIESRMGALHRCVQETSGLVAGYFFGTYGSPEQTPLSDVDLAFVFRPDSIPSGMEELEFRSRILHAVEQEDVSITILNRAPSPLQFKVLTTGRLFFRRDPVALADFVEGVLNTYCDFSVDYAAFLRDYDAALVEQYGDA
jgi:predicted nucleotidyltransferase